MSALAHRIAVFAVASIAAGTVLASSPSAQAAAIHSDGPGQLAVALDPLETAKAASSWVDAAAVCSERVESQTPLELNHFACGDALHDCATAAHGIDRLAGVTFYTDEQGRFDRACWTYDAGQNLYRTVGAPSGIAPAGAGDQRLDVIDHYVGTPKRTSSFAVAGPASSAASLVRISGVTLGITPVGGGEQAAQVLHYRAWDDSPRWVQVNETSTGLLRFTSGPEWSLDLDPSVCVQAGLCQVSPTLAFKGEGGHPYTATIVDPGA